jgi:competence protein ComEC
MGIICLLGYMNIHTLEVQENFADKLSDNATMAVLEGKAYDIVESDSYIMVYVAATHIITDETKKCSSMEYLGRTKVILYFNSGEIIKPGQIIKASGKLIRPDEATNPGAFDSRSYYAYKGIYMTMKDAAVEYASESSNILYTWLYNIRKKFSRIYNIIFSDSDSSIIEAMLLGEKRGIDRDIKRMYQINGIAHILAISGVHIAIIGMGIYKFLRKKSGSYLISGIVTIFLIIMYGMLTGMASSTGRAVIMLIILLIGNAIGRSSDMLTSAGIASVILAVINPYIIMDAGFQLSFAAVLGIALIYPVLEEICHLGDNHIVLKKLRQSVFISLSVSLATLPFIIYYYYQFPLYVVLLNLIVIPLVSVILICSILSGITGMLSLTIGGICAVPVKGILAFYRLLCSLWSRLPCYNINTGHISIKMVVVYYILLGTVLIFLIIWNRKGMNRAAVIISTFILCSGAVYVYMEHDTGFKIIFLDVGQGDGILIRTEAGTNIMIDGGSSSNDSVGEYVIAPAIRYYGMGNIDYAIVTHPDTDHISGLKYLLETDYTGVNIKNLVISKVADMTAYQELIALAEYNNINIIYVNAGDSFVEADKTSGCRLEVISPARDTLLTDENELSTVISFTYKNISALFTGDLGEAGEKELLGLNKLFKSNILKVGHHGSKYSTSEEFIEMVSPDISVISCGKYNSYGHPASETLERLDSVNSDVYITMDSGAVIISMEEQQLQVYEWIR